MPIIGGSVDWYIDPRWKIGATLAGLKADIGNVDGGIFVGAISTEYMFTRNLGIGLRYMYTDASVDADKDSFKGSADLRMNSVSLYAKFMF